MLNISKELVVAGGHEGMKQKAKVGIFKILSILIQIIIFLLLHQYNDEATDSKTKESGFDFEQGKQIFIYSTNFQTGSGVHSASYQKGIWRSLHGHNGRSVKLTICFNQMPRLRMGAPIPPVFHAPIQRGA
jgi:hypothetical protein